MGELCANQATEDGTERGRSLRASMDSSAGEGFCGTQQGLLKVGKGNQFTDSRRCVGYMLGVGMAQSNWIGVRFSILKRKGVPCQVMKGSA